MALLRSACIDASSSLLQALSVIDTSGIQMGLVVSKDFLLLGTLSDGDIRRALLSGSSTSIPVTEVMNKSYVSGTIYQSEEQHFNIMQSHKLRHLPLLDNAGILRNLVLCDSLSLRPSHDNPVVLMAGGLGSRLYPLTADTPKPMLLINGKPILHHIIDHYVKFGFTNFYLSVNYLKNVIMDYFGNGQSFGVTITYLEEDSPLGTAGALSLLPPDITSPIIVSNADILSSFNPSSLLRFHVDSPSSVTLCSRLHKTEVPFGVLEVENNILVGFTEKPVINHIVNAGIYVFDPPCLSHLDFNTKIDTPVFIDHLKQLGFCTSVYNLHEHWIDIGRPESLDQAILDFPVHYL